MTTSSSPSSRRARSAPRAPAKYVVVRDHLLALIADGLEPGSPIPSERELCETFSVSRMTVRQAIDTLVVDGALERHQGRGTFVSQPKLDLQLRLSSFTDEMRRRGMEPGSVFLTAETTRATPQVAQALEIATGDEVHHLRRLRTADSTPMAIEENWLTASLLPGLLEGALDFSVYQRLGEVGLEPSWGEDVIQGHVVSSEEAILLGVPEGAPALDITRRAFHDDVAVDYSRSLYRADRYTLWVPVAAPHPAASRPSALRTRMNQ
ncbi:GntR family transcriptional regulator [Actinomyces marmotae]|uniref:GntR family transcriptional regulator n=1 Tax=Actinomyces marmotae TaxID=2737173 RepID=A0A6M8B7Q6_9ACTO|nr:GntR family transcriptional regulator [Actinomyces marmotae]QKD80106.1 GntR family transcriptional regulator [Actinomyces marmotae]